MRSFLLDSGFRNSHSDPSLFIYNNPQHVLFLLVYVDDIIVTSSSEYILSEFVSSLAKIFSLKDLSNLSYFLGVEVLSHKHGLLLSQRRYITNPLTRLNMLDAKPMLTHIPSSASAISLLSGSPLQNPTEYREVLGSLQYLSLTRSDVSFAVNKLS